MANCICFELRPRTNAGWDTTVLSPNPSRVPQVRTGAPCSHQRTWAENDGRSPTIVFIFEPITSSNLGKATSRPPRKEFDRASLRRDDKENYDASKAERLLNGNL